MAGLADLFARLEQERGLPAGFLARTRAIESANGTQLVSPTGAKGDFQFTRGTAKQYGLADPFDPADSARAAADYARDNKAYLEKKLGRPVGGGELYLAHQQGAGGAANLLANPDAAATGFNQQVNGGKAGDTGGAFANRWISKFEGAPAAPSPIEMAFAGSRVPQATPDGRAPMAGTQLAEALPGAVLPELPTVLTPAPKIDIAPAQTMTPMALADVFSKNLPKALQEAAMQKRSGVQSRPFDLASVLGGTRAPLLVGRQG